ncbi:MAG: oligosaccharide flippase family protein, partial [Chloroflexota bacterium]
MKAAFRWLWLPFKDATSTAMSAEGRQQVLSTPLYANSIYLMATSAATAALGFAFWMVVARLYTAEAVGLGSALLSAAALVSYVASLGLGMGLIRFLTDARGSVAALINSCFTITGFIALILSTIFLAGLPLWSPAMSFVWDNPGFAVAFVIFATASSLYGLLSEVFVALRRTEFLLVQGIFFGLLKLGLVVVLAGLFEAFGIFASWGLAATAMLGLGLLLFLPRLLPAYRPVPTLRRQVSSEMIHFSFANYVGTGLWSAPSWLLPLLVVNMLGSEVNAYFYLSWAMASLLFVIPLSAATSLFAEGSHQKGYLARDAMRSLKLILVLLLPAIAVMVVAGDKLLLLFGREYSL